MKRLIAFLLVTLMLLVAYVGVVYLVSDGLRSVVVSRVVDHRPKLYVFHAEWCGFCPSDERIAELQANYPGVNIVNVDIDEQPELKKRFHADRIPLFAWCEGDKCRTTRSIHEAEGWCREY